MTVDDLLLAQWHQATEAERAAALAALENLVVEKLEPTDFYPGDRQECPHVHVYAATRPAGQLKVYAVADHLTYYTAQSGSDWALHHILLLEGGSVTAHEQWYLTESQYETDDQAASVAAARNHAAAKLRGQMFDPTLVSLRILGIEKTLHHLVERQRPRQEALLTELRQQAEFLKTRHAPRTSPPTAWPFYPSGSKIDSNDYWTGEEFGVQLANEQTRALTLPEICQIVLEFCAATDNPPKTDWPTGIAKAMKQRLQERFGPLPAHPAQ